MFVRGGYVNLGYSLKNAGYQGTYWPSVSYFDYGAYDLYFDPYGVNLLGNGYRYFGFSVRCVALGG